jgi:hypothetical protein
MILSNQTELDSAERERLSELERTQGLLGNAESMFKKEVAMLEIKLMDNPDYQRLVKMAQKVRTARDMARKNRVILDNEYQKIFSARGIEAVAADLYADALPEARPKGRRGRPKLLKGAA